MRTITLRHIDGREFARIYESFLKAPVIEAIMFEFGCREDDIFYNDDHIYIDDKLVATAEVNY